jgi:hypothetical protein
VSDRWPIAGERGDVFAEVSRAYQEADLHNKNAASLLAIEGDLDQLGVAQTRAAIVEAMSS